MNNISLYQVPLQKYVDMMELQIGISTHLSYIVNVSMRLVSFFHDLFYSVGSALNCFLIELSLQVNDSLQFGKKKNMNLLCKN